jgi:dimethylglycine dehydrogenase
MKSHVQVAVIGGGVVGCSVLYHLTKRGWKDVALIERSELTSGSTWHAAGGFHTLNGDPNVAKLQAYTVGLYKEIEAILGPVLRAAPDAADCNSPTRPSAGMAEDGACRGPLSRHGNGDHLQRRSQAVWPPYRREVFVRTMWDPWRATSTPT